MAASLSKRQIARNEKDLQDLIENVPGNDRCADCDTKNPGWASWNLGIFLCIRCASLHRKLGTHISKVKSLSMDTWTVEQVDSMKSKGNIISNSIYNPRGKKFYAPNDMNDADGAMERFIRQKYEQKSLANGAAERPQRSVSASDYAARSPVYPEDPLPHLTPQKTGRARFGLGLRSASSLVPKRFQKQKDTYAVSNTYHGGNDSEFSTLSNKQSRVLGSKLGDREDTGFDAKLAQLREMGFKDSRQNSVALRAADGDLDRAIERLVRSAESSKPARASTPDSMTGSAKAPSIKVEKQRSTAASNNPFGKPQRSATAPLPQSNPVFAASYNPFLQPQQQPQQYQPIQPLQPQPTLNQSFQQLSVSQAAPQYQSTQYGQNPFLPQNQQPAQNIPAHLYSQPHLLQPQMTGAPIAGDNQAQHSQHFAQMNPWQTGQGANGQLPQHTFQQQQQQPHQQQQSLVPAPPPPQQQQQQQQQAAFSSQMPGLMPQATGNPFLASQQQNAQVTNQQQTYLPNGAIPQVQPQASTQPNPFPTQQSQPQQGQFPQQRLDKTSILALYNQPQAVAHQIPQSQIPQQQANQQQQQQQVSQQGMNGAYQQQPMLSNMYHQQVYDPGVQYMQSPMQNGMQNGTQNPFYQR